MANKKKRSKPKAPQRKSTRQCIRTDKYGGEYYDEHSMNTSVASPVGQGQPVAASSNDASGANHSGQMGSDPLQEFSFPLDKESPS